jgi:hypothetical protein
MNGKPFDELSFDDSLFVGVTYDLAQPIYLNGEDYDTLLTEAPEAAYVVNVHYRVHMLVRRFASLNIVFNLLAYSDFPITTPAGMISREQWVRVTLDVLLSRLTSIRDCVFLLISETFELGLDPKNTSRYKIKSHTKIAPLTTLCALIDEISEIGRDFRNERDRHLHRGEERELGENPLIYMSVSMLETIGKEGGSTDESGNPVDLDNEHKKVVEQLLDEFTSTTKELDEKIHELFDVVYPHFKSILLNKFDLSGNPTEGAISLIERAEYYSKYVSRSE